MKDVSSLHCRNSRACDLLSMVPSMKRRGGDASARGCMVLSQMCSGLAPGRKPVDAVAARDGPEAVRYP